MPTGYYMVILQVEHDGNATPDELVQGLGMALDDLGLEMTLTVVDDMTSHVTVTECLGVDEIQHAQVEELLEARKEQSRGT